MGPQVVDLDGNPFRTERWEELDGNLVERLEDLLEQARSGRLIGLSYIGQLSDGLCSRGHGGRMEASYRTVGAARMLCRDLEGLVSSTEELFSTKWLAGLGLKWQIVGKFSRIGRVRG